MERRSLLKGLLSLPLFGVLGAVKEVAAVESEPKKDPDNFYDWDFECHPHSEIFPTVPIANCALTSQDIGDLVNTTIRHLGPVKFQGPMNFQDFFTYKSMHGSLDKMGSLNAKQDLFKMP